MNDNTQSKSQKRRVAIQKEGEVKEETKQSEVCLKAVKNTFLPDGAFVKEGDEIKVSAEYAEIALANPNGPFVKA